MSLSLPSRPSQTWGVQVERTTFTDDRPIRVAPQRSRAYKIALCTGGHGEYRVDEELVPSTPYSVQVVRPDQKYGYQSRFLPVEGCSYYALYVDKELAHDLSSGSSPLSLRDGQLLTGSEPSRVLMSACLALTTTQQERCCHKIVRELLTTLRDSAQGKEFSTHFRPELHNALARARRHLEQNFEKVVPLQELAEKACLTPNYLNTLFRTHYGTPPQQYQMQLRLAKARCLLSSSTSSSEVAQQCGFSDQAHFSRQFKRFMGSSPGKYRATMETESLKIVRSFKTGPLSPP